MTRGPGQPQQLVLDGVDQEHAPARSGRRHPGPGMSEAQLLAAVRRLARLRQWLTYHTHLSRHSEPGWPDLVLLSVHQRRLLIVELKTDTGATSPEQDQWLAALAACGIEVAIWRPRDLVDVAAILGGRRIDPTEYGIQPLTPEQMRWRR
jgi:hypothetical protein